MHAHRRGFTLIELVLVIIILSVLAAIAVPIFINFGKNARIASLNTLSAALNATTANVRALCKTNPACDYSLRAQTVTIGGQSARVNYGWLDSGDSLNGGQVDSWVSYSGFTPSLFGSSTLFSLDDAPDPSNCSVRYTDTYATLNPAALPVIATVSTGC